MKRVVLFYPALTNGEDAPTLYVDLPLSVVTLAAQLDPAEYEVEIIDERLRSCTQREIAEKVSGALFVGVSAITSYQIVNGLRFAQTVRESDPAVPIVWGGWHPSLMPEETIAHPLVDMAILGQGERILPLLAHRLARGESLDDVPNLWWKRDGRVTRNPRREYSDFQMPCNLITGYARLDLAPYVHPQWGHKRVIGYESSRGCPFACAFCSISAVFQRRWYGLEAERVAGTSPGSRITTPSTRYTFLTITSFSTAAARRQSPSSFASGGSTLPGTVRLSLSSLCNLLRLRLSVCGRAGCLESLVGGESGDDGSAPGAFTSSIPTSRCLESVRMRREFGLLPLFPSFMAGFPRDPARDVRRTIALIEQIKRICPHTEILLFLFSPYLGTPLYEVAKGLRGVHLPPRLRVGRALPMSEADRLGLHRRFIGKSLVTLLGSFGTKALSGEEEAFQRL